MGPSFPPKACGEKKREKRREEMKVRPGVTSQVCRWKVARRRQQRTPGEPLGHVNRGERLENNEAKMRRKLEERSNKQKA